MIDPFVHAIAGLAVCSRAADVWTTYLVTPTLKLEANAIVRRFRWKFALLTIPVGLVAYVWPPLGVIVLTASFMVSASNASKIGVAKVLGEEELAALSRRILLATPPWPGLLYLVMPGLFVGVIGGALLLCYPHTSQWGYYFGVGMLAYTLAVLIWYPVGYFRVRAAARKTPEAASPHPSAHPQQ